MPVSLKYRSILIHIPKTAGTSIEKVLDVYARRDCLHGVYNDVCLQHLTADELMNFIGKDLYQNFFSFALVRNPWDRCVSEYAFLQKVGASLVAGLSFSQFVHHLPKQKGNLPKHIYQHLRPQSDFLFDEKGNRLVDYIGSFERLGDSWDTITKEIHNRSGLVPTKDLPREHASDHEHYSKYYDSNTREVVGRIYHEDIKLHQYQFEYA